MLNYKTFLIKQNVEKYQDVEMKVFIIIHMVKIVIKKNKLKQNILQKQHVKQVDTELMDKFLIHY